MSKKATEYRIVFQNTTTQIAFSPEQAIKRSRLKGNIPLMCQVVRVERIKKTNQ